MLCAQLCLELAVGFWAPSPLRLQAISLVSGEQIRSSLRLPPVLTLKEHHSFLCSRGPAHDPTCFVFQEKQLLGLPSQTALQREFISKALGLDTSFENKEAGVRTHRMQCRGH